MKALVVPLVVYVYLVALVEETQPKKYFWHFALLVIFLIVMLKGLMLCLFRIEYIGQEISPDQLNFLPSDAACAIARVKPNFPKAFIKNDSTVFFKEKYSFFWETLNRTFGRWS